MSGGFTRRDGAEACRRRRRLRFLLGASAAAPAIRHPLAGKSGLHGLSVIRRPQISQGFQAAFDYVDATAPKGGRMTSSRRTGPTTRIRRPSTR